MAQRFIKSEDDAWFLLESIRSGELREEIVHLSFEEWPNINLHISGPKFNGTITGTAMEGFLELQRNLRRSFSQIAYKKSTARNLTDEDRNDIELVVRVEKGSSTYTAAFGPALEKLAAAIGDKMDGQTMAATIISLALLYCGRSIWMKSIEAKAKTKGIDAEMHLREQETKRWEMMTDILRNDKVLSEVNEDAEASVNALLKVVATGDKASAQGIALDPSMASQLVTSIRGRSKEVRLDGIYKVTSVDNGNTESPRVRLMANDGTEFNALYVEDNWTQEQRQLFQDLIWNKQSAYLRVNAKKIREDVVSAAVVGIGEEQQPSHIAANH